jgi:hypothetical protein
MGARGRGLVVGHPRHLRLVNIGVVNLDGVLVLVMLVHVGVNTNLAGVTEVDAIVLAGRTTLSSTTTAAASGALLGAGRVGTAEGGNTTLRDEGAGTPELREGRTGVDILVLHVNGVVISVALVDTSMGVDGDGHVELLAPIVARRSTHSSPTLLGLPTTLEGRAERKRGRRRVDVGVLEVNGVVIVAVLVHLGVEVGVNTVVKVQAVVLSRRSAHNGRTGLAGVREASRSISRSISRTLATARSTHESATLLMTPALLESLGRDVVVLRSTLLSLAETRAEGVHECRGRVRNWRVHGRVDLLVLELDRVVVLALLIDLCEEVAGNRHVEDLALVVARGATHSSAAVRRAALVTLGEGAHSGSHGDSVGDGCSRRREDILVLHVDRVVVLAELVDIGVSVDVGSHRGEATVRISARGTTHGSTTPVRPNTMALNTVVLVRVSALCSYDFGSQLTVCSIAWAATASRAMGIPPTKPFMMLAKIEYYL